MIWTLDSMAYTIHTNLAESTPASFASLTRDPTGTLVRFTTVD